MDSEDPKQMGSTHALILCAWLHPRKPATVSHGELCRRGRQLGEELHVGLRRIQALHPNTLAAVFGMRSDAGLPIVHNGAPAPREGT